MALHRPLQIVALAALAVLPVACKPRPVPQPEEYPTLRRGAVPEANRRPCLLGTIDDCSRCGDRCATGLCRAGRCEALPRPFAERVAGPRHWVVDRDGVVLTDYRGKTTRHSELTGVQTLPRTRWGFSPFGYADGYYYGTGESWVILKTRDLTVEPVVAERLLFDRYGKRARSFNADESGVYSGRHAVRDGRLSAEVQLPPWPQSGWDRNYVMNRSSIFWTDWYARQYGDSPDCFTGRGHEETFEKTAYLKAVDKDGTHPRILAFGNAVSGRNGYDVFRGVAVDDRWVYYVQGHDGPLMVTLNCVPASGGPSRTFMTAKQEDSLTLYGISNSYLYLGLLGNDPVAGPNGERLRGRDLYRIALPVCQ